MMTGNGWNKRIKIVKEAYVYEKNLDVMLFGIMLLMAKSNNVYAETYETDLSQYNVGDNILQTTFEINTDEECEYEIVESGTFHNGHAVVMMKERSDEEADEESGDEELFLGYINDKLELRCNLTGNVWM